MCLVSFISVFADVGGGQSTGYDGLGVELAGRQRSAECPKHPPKAHQWTGAQLCKKQHTKM